MAETKKLAVSAYLRDDNVQKRVNELLGKRSSQFITALMSATNNVAHLSECTPASVLNAALTVAALDLPINNNLGFAYLIPYKNKGVYEAQFQMGWKGFIQLAQRSGQYKTIAATPVFEGQLIRSLATSRASSSSTDSQKISTCRWKKFELTPNASRKVSATLRDPGPMTLTQWQTRPSSKCSSPNMVL
jgi:recombination protein RecT